MGSRVTAGMLVMVWYRAAYICKYSGDTKSVVRTKMIEAARSATLELELDAALTEASETGGFDDIEGHVFNWKMVQYLPYSREANF